MRSMQEPAGPLTLPREEPSEQVCRGQDIDAGSSVGPPVWPRRGQLGTRFVLQITGAPGRCGDRKPRLYGPTWLEPQLKDRGQCIQEHLGFQAQAS